MKRSLPRLAFGKGAPILLILALLVALLVFAATAAAEIRTGEASSAFAEGAPSPEETIVKGAASYDSTSGNVVFNVTTVVEPQSETDPSGSVMFLALFTTSGGCDSSKTTVVGLETSKSQILLIENLYEEPAAKADLGRFGSEEFVPLQAAKTVAGTTTTLSISSGSLAEMGFNCAVAFLGDR